MTSLTEIKSRVDLQTGYPKSYSSYREACRSRVLSEDIATFWNVPITGIESIEDRARKYLLFFTLKSDQIKCIYHNFSKHMDNSLKQSKLVKTQSPGCENTLPIKLCDTFVPGTISFLKITKMAKVALHFHEEGAASACASVITMNKNGSLYPTKTTLDLSLGNKEYPKGLLDYKTPAIYLFDSLAGLLKKAIDSNEYIKYTPSISSLKKVGVSVGFPVEQRSLFEATLLRWTRGFATGRNTQDPAEGMDLNALLDCAFARANMPAKVTAVINDAVATYITAWYEKPPGLPQCGLGFTLGHGVNLCFYSLEAHSVYGFASSLINCDIGNFDEDLPMNDVDVKVDFRDELTQGKQQFEKMVAVNYLEELCRRLVVKVWQSEAPRLAWVHNSMPWLACVRIIDDSERNTLPVVEKILGDLWDWETTYEQRRAVQELFQAVFDRAALMCAIAICTAATHTGLLQPAMGGVTVAVAGDLYHHSAYFRQRLSDHPRQILDSEIVPLLYFYEVEDGIAKGAALATELN